jgi:hypothetical protein
VGVTSEIVPTSRPTAPSERIASRVRAGALDEDVDLLHAVLHRPATGRLGGHLGGERRRLAGALDPTVPALAQAMTAPTGSVMVTIVLLNVDLMCAWPATTFFFSLRRTFLAHRAGDPWVASEMYS